MTWPEALRDIIYAVAGAVLALAIWTDFWSIIFNRPRVRKVEVIPSSLIVAINDVMQEMLSYSYTSGAPTPTIRGWIDELEAALDEAREGLED